MSLRNDIVSFWFWGYRGDLRIELQAPVNWARTDALIDSHSDYSAHLPCCAIIRFSNQCLDNVKMYEYILIKMYCAVQ